MNDIYSSPIIGEKNYCVCPHIGVVSTCSSVSNMHFQCFEHEYNIGDKFQMSTYFSE